MSTFPNDPLLQVETTCGSLLYELQIIWDEVGESDSDRDRMLLQLEQECLEVYRRKVDQANRLRAQLRQTIADSEAELAAICSAMGEPPVHIRQSDLNGRKLKEELKAIVPQVEAMRKRKFERKIQFVEVVEQIQKLSNELYGSNASIILNETDLSLRKLEELHTQLQSLQKEKSDRLKQVLEHLSSLNSLCLVLGMDFKSTVAEIHPSLGENEAAKNINNDTIDKLAGAIKKLREVKIQRMQKLQDLATTMLELWDLMNTPLEEQQMFQNVTCNVAASEHEITEPNTLSEDFIKYVGEEVSRLEDLKSSKMKELILKKRSELEEICRKTHMVPEGDGAMDYVIEAIESGVVDPTCVLQQIELQIINVKEEAFSRKEILERVEKWLSSCEEESWLEEYNRDDNRYNAGRGAHLTLKRAEKARALVNKLPAMVEALASKTMAWEKEKGLEFTYDGIRVLAMLEEYAIVRQEKEQEQKRQRDQKKLQGQLIAEQEALYGSKPSPAKQQNKKTPRMSMGGAATNRRVSLGGAVHHQTPKSDLLHSARATPNTRVIKKTEQLYRNEQINHHQDDGIGGLSAGSRGLDIAGLPVRKHSFNHTNNHEFESPIVRKPFSPVSPTPSLKENTKTSFEDQNISQTEPLQKPSMPFSTPSKIVSVVDEENYTPSTVSVVPMQTGITPAHPVPATLYGGKIVEEMPEEIDYSFEERRAGFVLPKAHIKSLIPI